MQFDFAQEHLNELRAGLATSIPEFAPLDPFDSTPKPPSFPVDALPKSIADYVEANAAFLQVDPAMLATCALAACALCVQGKCAVTPETGWKEPLNLFTAVVARPSERKTPSIDAITKPVREYVTEWNTDRMPLIEDYQDQLAIISKQIRIAQEKAAVGKDNDLGLLRTRKRTLEESPEEPLRLYCGDSTPEALLDLISKNGGKMALISDEGGILTTVSGSRYGNETWIDPLLKAYSGSEIQIARKTQGSIDIPNPVLTICCMMQPQTLEELTGNTEFIGRGLLARFLIALPESRVGARVLGVEPPPPEVSAAYGSLIRSLLEMRGDETPRVIEFSPEAKDSSRTYFSKIEAELPEARPALESWLGKLHGTFARLAGILHVCKHLDDADEIPVDIETAAHACQIAEYFKACAEIIYSNVADDTDTAEAKYVWARIHSTGKAEISKHDLLRVCRRYKQAAEMDAGLDVLIRRGYVAVQTTNTGQKGRPAVTVYVNPEAA